MFRRPLALPEQGKVTSYVVQTDGNEFSFLPVPKWHVESNGAEKQVTLLARDLSTSISVRIVTKTAGAPSEIKSEPLRQLIQERFPKATIVGEFPCFSDSGQGLAFDLVQTVRKNFNTATRLAFIPFSDGVVEFKLTTPQKDFPNYKLALGNLLTSFRIEPVTPAP